MIRLINNEFRKVKKSKLIFSQFLFVLVIYIMNRLSDKSLFELTINLIPFVGIMTSIFYGGTISGEIENGNMRYYLTKPFKRWKIYLSKLISIFICISLTLIIIIISSIIIEGSFDKDYIYRFSLYSIPIFFIGTFILYLSTILKNSTLSVGLSIFILSFSLIISQLLFGVKFNIIEYTFLPYLDFSLFDDEFVLINMNNELGTNLSMNKGIIIDFVYMFILYFLGNRKFIKKDIKG